MVPYCVKDYCFYCMTCYRERSGQKIEDIGFGDMKRAAALLDCIDHRLWGFGMLSMPLLRDIYQLLCR